MDEYIDQLLAETQTPVPVQSVVKNILDVSIPEGVKRRLVRPLLPKKFRPSPPLRPRRERKRKAIMEEFDHILVLPKKLD